MARKERRAKALAQRKQLKKGRGALDDAAFVWMASLLPADGGRVLEVGADPRGTAALESHAWQVVTIDAGAVLAQGAFGGEVVDAVTCWLLEPPRGREDVTEKLEAMGLSTADEARLALHTLVYRLTDRVLRPGGTLQIVDHVMDPLDEALAAGRVRLQRAQAKGTTLEFASLDVRPLGVGALVSVRSRKA